ncbi:putative Fungal-specific transcription factor domain protein [Seiridium unicorne]|uniref:Fungal-specific transcription factor domain protein n=1 Tax=Seiridium unicorne TaxID=138068 RepID=A0ABR2VGJ6_9PEZI
MDMEAEAEAAGGGASPGGIRRACDQCRLRKIRCDKESPCSNCKSAKRSCSSTGLGQKPKEPKQRVLISSQYERKIDDMQERLAGIEHLLQKLTTSNTSTTAILSSASTVAVDRSSTSNTPRTASKPTPTSSASHDDSATVFDPEDVESFEGNSSLTAHAAFASELVSQAVQTSMLASTPFSVSNPRMEAALSSLRQMVNLQTSRGTAGHEGTSQTSKTVPRGRLRDLPMPPMEFVIEKLRELKAAPGPMMLLIVTCFTDVDQFTDRCRHLYFCTDEVDVSESLFIIVNAGLMYLFFEGSITAPAGSREKAKLQRCCQMCQDNVEAGLAHLPLLMPANLENVEALLMGASFSIDMSRPSLSWLLTSRAAHMCRTLGLHQESSVRNDTAEMRASKALLFWSTYMLDKGLSLRLGRASILQDYDISLPSVLESSFGEQPSQAILSLWIKHAEVQGKIYQRLYSPGALRQSEQGRSQQVQLVVRDVEFLLRETLRLLDDVRAQGQSKDAKMFEIILKSDEVSYYSSLALAQRALPPSGTGSSRTFADECLESARAAMTSHEEAMAMMDDISLQIVYMHWTILYAPFIPFVVIFCHVIETSAASDLLLLEKFVQSLQASCQISAAIDKLHQLSKVLYNVALLYVETKSQQALDQDMVPVGNEFDMYLSQLGFMPIDETMADNTNAGDDLTRNLLQTAQLGDWFSGGNHVMGLIEEDLSTFNTSAW